MAGDQIRPECVEKFAMLAEHYAVLENEMKHNNEMTTAILKAVNGNGKVGIATDVEVLKSSLNRAWIWLGGVSLGIFGIACWVIKMG